MTPEWIRERLAELDVHLGAIDAERALIVQIRGGLEQLLVLHGSEPTRPDPGVSAAATVDCPECGTTVKQRGLGVHRRQAHGRRTTTTQPKLEAVRPPRIPRTSPFEVELEVDEPEADPPAAPAPAVPREKWTPTAVVATAAAIPSGPESFLCERCQEPFPTRPALAEHRREHPAVPPAYTPMGRARSPLDVAMGS